MAVSAARPQISGHVSEGTRQQLDRLSRDRGLRKGYMLEQALLYYFRALEELPEEAQLPPRILVDGEDWRRLSEAVAQPPSPTAALRELMDGTGD